jgi:SAM-dependent methyltransferase
MKILDATCGERSIWFQKNHPFVIYMDMRKGKFDTKTGNTKKSHGVVKINPDVQSEWKDAPFPDNYFDMIIFDPPHMIKNSDGSLDMRYGKLSPNNWNIVLKEGIEKLFNILKPEGVFILKWAECSKKVDDVLKLFPYPPLFGTRTGLNNKNLWILFLKYDINHKLEG